MAIDGCGRRGRRCGAGGGRRRRRSTMGGGPGGATGSREARGWAGVGRKWEENYCNLFMWRTLCIVLYFMYLNTSQKMPVSTIMLRSSLHIRCTPHYIPITPLKHDSDNRKSPLLCSQCRRNCTAMREFPQISSNPVNEESFYQRFSHPRQFRWFNVVSVVQRGRDSPRVDQIRQNYGRDGRS